MRRSIHRANAILAAEAEREARAARMEEARQAGENRGVGRLTRDGRADARAAIAPV